MTDPMEKVRVMVAGRLHVDSNRIDGDLFREMASDNIRADEDEGCSCVFDPTGKGDEEASHRDSLESYPCGGDQ